MATQKTTAKAVKKVVETPIDQRETFVSLSKKMNDADGIAMEEKLHTLYQVQLTDTKIDKIHLLRGELPLEVEDLEDEVAGLKTRLENAQSDIKDAEQRVSDYKHQGEEAKKLMAKYEGQRDNVKNNREYESISKEIEYQELEQLSCEKKSREALAFIAEKQELVEKTKGELAGREEDLEVKKKELESIIEETAKEEAQLVAQKEALCAKLDERMLIAYDKVRSNAHNHLAVVTVQRDACGGCFNKIPPQRQLDIASNKKIIVCEYCGRILVSPDFEEKAE